MISVGSNKLKWGFIDKKGNEIVEMKYEGVNNFKDGYAVVSKLLKTSEGTEHKYGLINKKGIITIPIIYNSLSINNQLIEIQYNNEGSIFYSLLNGKLLRELESRKENNSKTEIMTFNGCDCGAQSCMLDFIDENGKHHEFPMESVESYDFNCPTGDTYKNVRFEIEFETVVTKYEQFTETNESLISIKILEN